MISDLSALMRGAHAAAVRDLGGVAGRSERHGDEIVNVVRGEPPQRRRRDRGVSGQQIEIAGQEPHRLDAAGDR